MQADNTSNSANSNTHQDNQDITNDYSDDIEGLIVPPDGYCFHCGDPVPNPPFFATVLGKSRQMCCMGCQLAAESIVEAGLEQYYLDRSEINRTASLPTQLYRLQAYDHDDVKSQFIYNQDGWSVAELSVNNLRCAACTWLIETRLYEIAGIHQCQVNLTNQRMRVIWDESILPISQILATIGQLGYEAKPYRQDTHEAMLARHNKKMMIRLGIAALGAMQAMMFAVAMYFGAYDGMSLVQRDFLRWVSLFVSVPVFFYAGIPFFASAWTAIKARQVNMDVPVSIALIITFFASLYATIVGHGETYYDSVSMFIFFLLAGRYIEHNARLKAATMANDLVVVEPIVLKKYDENISAANLLNQQMQVSGDDIANNISENKHQQLAKQLAQECWKRLQDNLSILNGLQALNDDTDLSQADTVTVQSLQVGDIVLVEAGSEVISDGLLLSEFATISQSMLTGESNLLLKKQGDIVVGGSQNDSQPFMMLALTLPEDSQMGLIDRLMNRAMSEKPKLAQQADRLARWFVARVLVLSVVVFVAWYFIDPSHAIWATVAVLVATCPCALSLATPIALTVATNRLASYGFLATRGHTLQTLAEVTHIAFDKTGTLTYGKPNLLAIENLSNQLPNSDGFNHQLTDNELLTIAAALEVGSCHPIAHALLTSAYQLHLPNTTKMAHYPAGGVEATIDNYQYRIGHISFACEHNQAMIDKLMQDNQQKLSQYQASSITILSVKSIKQNSKQNVTDNRVSNSSYQPIWQPLACFYFNDKLRDDTKWMINTLKQQDIETIMLTGDPNPQALVLADELGINQAYYGLSPEDKVAHIQKIQQEKVAKRSEQEQSNKNKQNTSKPSSKNVVLMIGDGINDAPVLAAANVSTAMAGAADLAQVSSDSVILNGKIAAIVDAKRIADTTQKIIRQNFRWAVGYNALVLLPAAFGYVPPWLAAIGMSLSSLLVVLNALRISRC